ncbi:TPA: AAA family ATPase, partial [Photobacterium damselae]
SSPLRIMHRAIESSISTNGNEDLLEKLREWSQGIQDIKLFNNGGLSNNLIGMNALSILSQLSKLINENAYYQNKVLFYFICVFSKLNIHHNENMSYHNCLRETVRSLEYKENWSIVDSEDPDFTLEDLNNLYNNIDIYKVKKVLEITLEQLFSLSNLIEDYGLEYTRVNNNVCKLEDTHLINEISELIGQLPNEISSNIRMGWRGVSTGELAYSHLFSETYHYLNSTKLDSENNIIIIDEVDLYLHPEWQRVFISRFIRLIQYCYKVNGANIPQVILTTHSPIITGDFLPRDIISLYKEPDEDEYSNGNIVVKPALGFGTSISDLYLDGMHLTAIFGEHSKGYIDGIIQRGKEKKLTDFDKALIGQISDKHIRNYLLIS